MKKILLLAAFALFGLNAWAQTGLVVVPPNLPTGTQGCPLINSSGAIIYQTSCTTIDVSQFSGATLDVQIRKALATIPLGGTGRLDASMLPSGTLAANPLQDLVASVNAAKCGTLIMSGSAFTQSANFAIPPCWAVVNAGYRVLSSTFNASGFIGSYYVAGGSLPATYNSGTVTNTAAVHTSTATAISDSSGTITITDATFTANYPAVGSWAAISGSSVANYNTNWQILSTGAGTATACIPQSGPGAQVGQCVSNSFGACASSCGTVTTSFQFVVTGTGFSAAQKGMIFAVCSGNTGSNGAACGNSLTAANGTYTGTAITGISEASTTVTVTSTLNPGTGTNNVNITGIAGNNATAGVTAYNGVVSVTSSSAGSFQYTAASSGLPTCSSGCGSAATVTVGALADGLVLQVNGTTSLTVQTAVAATGNANASGVNFVMYSPLVQLGTFAGANPTNDFGIVWLGGFVSCNYVNGCVPIADYSSQEGTYLGGGVNANSSTNIHIDWEGNGQRSDAQNSRIEDFIMGDVGCGTTSATMMTVRGVGASPRAIDHFTSTPNTCNGNVGVPVMIDFEVNGELWDGHLEDGTSASTGVSVDVSDNLSCPVICLSANASGSGAYIHGINVGNDGGTIVQIGTSKSPTNLIVSDISANSGSTWTNTLFDGVQNCTDTTAAVPNLTLHLVGAGSPLSFFDASNGGCGGLLSKGPITGSSLTASGPNGGLSGTEGTGANCAVGAGIDCLYPNSTNHCLDENANNTDVGCVAAASNTLTLTNKSLSEDQLTGSAAQKTLTETAIGHEITRAGVETANLTYPYVFQNTNTTTTTSGALGINTAGAGGTGQVPLMVNEAVAAGDLMDLETGGSFASGVFTAGTKQFGVSSGGKVTAYGGLATTGNGVGSVVASSGAVTIGTGTSIAATSLCSTTQCPAGRYQVKVYIDITTACTTTGSYIPWLGYTDDAGAKAGSSTTTYFAAAGGLGVTPATASAGATLVPISTTDFMTGDFFVTTTGAATGGLGAINYGTTATACGSGGPMVGKMYFDVVRLE